MFVTKSISAEHKDLIHDVAYDFHGRRMATCSSDQSVQVWDIGEDSEWHCTANWRTHSGSVWRVTWAHPEFGQVLATCSFDRTAAVWEEVVGESNPNHRGQNHWVKRTQLVDSRTSVTDVKFAPKHLGRNNIILRIELCVVDIAVRLQNEISCKMNCSCISWNPSRVHPAMISVGSDDPSTTGGGKVQVYEYSDGNRKWNKVETLMTVTEAVHDVAFAPNLGRSYHLLAVASKDVRIIMLKPLRRAQSTVGQHSGVTRFEVRQPAQFDEHNSQVWRVNWNITGTILASSGDDGCVRLWKANYLDNWKCIGVLKADGTHHGPGHSGRSHSSHVVGTSATSGASSSSSGAAAGNSSQSSTRVRFTVSPVTDIRVDQKYSVFF
ncbi:nucleoporin SEH1-A-like [Saccoglossus kowalevskii]